MRTPSSSLDLRAWFQIGAAILALGASAPASAGAPFSEYSCRELWLERNGIYANKGHCFETNRARREFGRGCRAPYGRLNASERRAVAEIRRWESRKGCSD